MAYGIEFYNQEGKLQIASGVNNFYMAEKGILNVTNGSVFCTIAPTVPYDAIAVFCPTMAILPKSIFSSVQAANTPQTFRKANTSNATINWYAYRNYNSVAKATSGYGIEIYNADGTTVNFSSNFPKILKGIKIPIPDANATATPVDVSREYAFLQYGTNRGLVTVTEPMGGGQYDSPTDRFVYRFSSSYNSIQSSQVRARQYATTEPIGFTGGLLAVDVTNY